MRPACAAVLALCLGAASSAAAHGREPVIGQVAFDPADPAHFILRGTWAFLTTRDGGERFTWSCAVAIDYDRLTEDPPVAITASGRVVLGTFDGLRRSSPDACDYGDGAALAWGSYAIDVQNDPHDDRGLWVAMSPGDRANTLLRSGDEGERFEVVHSFEPGVLLERVRPAPSDPMRLYVTAAVPRSGMEPRHVYFFRSEDRGASFERVEIPLLDEERNAHVLAVDPTDPERALVRMTRLVTDEVPERLLLTEDGGRSFRTVLETLEIVGVVFSHDGTRAWAGSWDGGLHRSEDGGRTFATIDPDLRVRCLAERAIGEGRSELFVCVDELSNDYAVGRSSDGGDTIEPVWGFADVENVTGCSACSVVGAVCPAYWPDVLYDIAVIGGVDGGPPPGPADAGALECLEGGVPLDADLVQPDAARVLAGDGGSCACRASARGGGPLAWLGATLVVLAAADRGRRRLRERPRNQGFR